MKYSDKEQSGINIVSYKALTVEANQTTVMLLISAGSYTHWMCIELVTEMAELLSDSLSTTDYKEF